MMFTSHYTAPNVAVKGGSASAPSAIVSGAGTAAANGNYNPAGTHEGKPFYTLSGTNPLVAAVSWEPVSTRWVIWDSESSDLYVGDALDVAFPWLVSWNTGVGEEPSPTVTQG